MNDLKSAAADKTLLDSIRTIVQPGQKTFDEKRQAFRQQLIEAYKEPELNPLVSTNRGSWHDRERVKHHTEQAINCFSQAEMCDNMQDIPLAKGYRECGNMHKARADYHANKLGMKAASK